MLRKLILTAGLLLSAAAYGQSTSGWATVTMQAGGDLYTNGVRVAAVSVDQITVLTNWGWEDLRFPVSAFTVKPNNTDIAVNEANNSVTFKTTASTNRTTSDHIYGVAQMPHTWRAGSDVEPHVHFEQSNADQTNTWYLYYRLQPLGGEIVTDWTFTGPASNYLAYASNTIHQLATFGRIDMTGLGESSIIDWKLYRLGSAGTGNIEVKEFDIHYQIEKPTGERFGN